MKHDKNLNLPLTVDVDSPHRNVAFGVIPEEIKSPYGIFTTRFKKKKMRAISRALLSEIVSTLPDPVRVSPSWIRCLVGARCYCRGC
jgi:hypothetical protein